MIKVLATYKAARYNEHGEAWFRFEVPLEEAENLEPCVRMTENDKVNVLLRLENGEYAYRGCGKWNGMNGNAGGEHIVSIRADYGLLDVTPNGVIEQVFTVFLLSDAEWEELKASLKASGISFEGSDTDVAKQYEVTV